MKDITKQIGATLQSYAVCIPTGNRLTDTTNGFFMTMNKNVDVFAENIRKDANLRGGFNCKRAPATRRHPASARHSRCQSVRAHAHAYVSCTRVHRAPCVCHRCGLQPGQ